jgi:hypothetical protein
MPTPISALVGARAKLYINGSLVGVFTTCSYSVTIDTQPIYILGRYNAAEQVITGQGLVEIDVSGLRCVDRSPYVVASVPKLQDLLGGGNEIQISIVDRQSGRAVLTALGCRATTYSSSTSARGVYDLSVHFSGVTLWDESDTAAQEDNGATEFA